MASILNDPKIICLNFFTKEKFKSEGPWMREPDLLLWHRYDLHCLALRNQETGAWRGLVGVAESHPFFNKDLSQLVEDTRALVLSVHDGITFTGLASGFDDKIWFLGFECSGGGDLLPADAHDDKREQIKGKQVYRDLKFVRSQINKLALQLSQVK